MGRRGVGRSLAGTACAFCVLAVAVALGGCGTESENQLHPGVEAGAASSGDNSKSPLVTDDGDVLLACGSRPAFWASAMDGGVSGLAEDAEVEAVLEQLLIEAGIDAPTELQRVGVADAEWMVLGKETVDGTEELILGLGSWHPEKGPIDGQYVVLDRTTDGWTAGGWGTCNVEPVLRGDVIWAGISATPVGLDPASSAVAVEVQELECTSGRDPLPFLRELTVIEDDETVTVYWTSDAPRGDQTCQGTPEVRRVIKLNEPLGDRALFDGSTWPPTRINGT